MSMRDNPYIADLLVKLGALGVTVRTNWETRRDQRLPNTRNPSDVYHVSFIGDDFTPTEATAIIINYGERNGFGLYLDSGTTKIDEDAAHIAKPREAAPAEADKVLLPGVEIQRRIENVNRYDEELNRLELVPNGDDYDAILKMMNGASYTAPHVKGR